MKAVTYTTYRGTKAITQTDGSQTISNGPLRGYGVTAAPIIHGDKTTPNPWSYTVTDVHYPRGTNVQRTTYTTGPLRGRTYVYTEVGCISFSDAHPFSSGVSYPSYLYNATLSKLNDKVRGTMDLSVAIAEAGQTAQMLKVTNTIRDFVTKYRGWRGLMKGISDARLQFSYGWAPLANDLYAAADESLRVVINEIEAVKVRSSEVIPDGSGTFTFQNYGSLEAPLGRNGNYTCEIGIKFRTSGHNIDRWASLNPASIAWELTPYSFVVDWIIDVGSYLRDVETSLLYSNSFVNGYITEGTHYDCKAEISGYRRSTPFGYVYDYFVNATASFRYRNIARSRLSGYPAPRPPSFNAELGSGRLLNLAALIGGKLRLNRR